MEKRNIIVIGASAGGFEALKKIVKGLSPNINASIFIVWHMSPDILGVLPQVLNKENTILAAHAYDKEPIKNNRIYVAPPDHHLLLEDGIVRITHGPKENRFRPAIDPLFRSAAFIYSNRVIGVVLSGALDDGTAGLWTIKNRGGMAIVQHPSDAEVAPMPQNAIREVAVDYIVTVNEIAGLLQKLSTETVPRITNAAAKDKLIKVEVNIANEISAFEEGIMKMGDTTPYTCPECHGTLIKIIEGNIARFRCHTGHAFSADTLLAAVTENIEDGLYNALRGVEESTMLLNHIGDHYAEANQPKLAAMYFKKAKEAETRAAIIRKTVLSHEQLSNETLILHTETENNTF